MFPHGGNQMSLAMAAGFGLGGAESYPGVFGDFGGFADDARIEAGMISLSDRPGIGFEGQQAFTALCANWRVSSPLFRALQHCRNLDRWLCAANAHVDL